MPIDGVGFQGHLGIQYPYPDTFAGEGAATPLDEAFQPKPAYFALRDALARAG